MGSPFFAPNFQMREAPLGIPVQPRPTPPLLRPFEADRSESQPVLDDAFRGLHLASPTQPPDCSCVFVGSVNLGRLVFF